VGKAVLGFHGLIMQVLAWREKQSLSILDEIVTSFRLDGTPRDDTD